MTKKDTPMVTYIHKHNAIKALDAQRRYRSKMQAVYRAYKNFELIKPTDLLIEVHPKEKCFTITHVPTGIAVGCDGFISTEKIFSLLQRKITEVSEKVRTGVIMLGRKGAKDER